MKKFYLISEHEFADNAFRKINKEMFEQTSDETDHINSQLELLQLHIKNLQNTKTSNCVFIQINRFESIRSLLKSIEKEVEIAENYFKSKIDL